jgi:glycosyltransferase involved in cell wall biosynthesis
MGRHLFIHPNFPGQFLHLARHLVAQGHEVTGIGEVENLKRQAKLVPGARLIGYKIPKEETNPHPHARVFEVAAARGRATLRVCLSLAKQGWKPEVIAAHTGWGDTLFLREAFPEARICGYFEYFYRPRGADIGFDPEFPVTLENRLEVRLKNATPLLAWEDCDARWTPTRWQASLFPEALQSGLRVLHEGFDTATIRPDLQAGIVLEGGIKIRVGDEIVTCVNRSLEPYRGLHVFLRALPEILQRRPNARVLIIGRDRETPYGNSPAEGTSWKEIFMKEIEGRIDMSRLHFLGRLPHEAHVKVLQVSAAHVYLSYPYFLSWSMLEAMSAGCLLIGSNTPPVAEFVENGVNGLLVDFFDAESLAERVCVALERPGEFMKMRRAAREMLVSKLDRDRVCVPALLDFLHGV